MPKLSIIVPIYNSEKYLNKCLDSIRNQTFNDFECIMINDGSVDNSESICKDYALKDKRFILINQSNKGASAARNEGLKQANGEYISFIDSDDWINCDTYNDCIIYLEEEYDLVCFGMLRNGVKVSFKKSNIEKQFIKYQVYMNSPCNKLYKRKILNENNISFFEIIHTSEDFLFNVEYINYCNNIFYVNKYYYNYRINMNSITNASTMKKNGESLCAIADILPKILPYHFQLLINYRKFIAKYYVYNYNKNFSFFISKYPESNKFLSQYNLPLISYIKITILLLINRLKGYK